MEGKKRLYKILGFTILIVSCVLFLLIPVIPFLGFTVGQAAGISTGLLISGEVLFYLSLFILGRSFYDKVKSKLAFWKSKFWPKKNNSQ